MSFLSPKLLLLFEKYINLDTSRDDGRHYSEAIDLLANYLHNFDFKIEKYKIPPKFTLGKKNRIHLVARKFLSNKIPTLLVYNHIDVVPANYTDAFRFKFNDKRVYGRGTADHKGSTIAVLSALSKISHDKLRFNIVFWASTDEETNQFSQIEYMKNKLSLPENTLVFDPDTFSGGISIASLGALQLKLTTIGKSVHSGMSHLGKNAVEDMARVVVFLQSKIKPKLEKQVSKFKTFPESNASEICGRCNVNMVEGGIASNVVPDETRAKVDIRFVPDVNQKKEEKLIIEELAIYAKKEKIKLNIEVIGSILGNSCNHTEIDLLDKLNEEITGESGKYCVMGSTPMSDWCKKYNLPHFGIGVARFDSNVHGNNESALIKDIKNLEKLMVKYLTEASSRT